ncbi:MFS transporter [Pseudoclavibacter chungangensis]|uniref:MFS transporter n=1 Tax=Pseudoclavibacter chungangensis TaxID=587635 RepID=A0A7J5BNC4_9MICO|nr:MFS transporter [Pseudoclavibacter chungangensis]KAB1652961.1 MFS transporter [Pseudoclavibacter chungangensis]NYJ65241.1 MFS family permease [Pseudoclavibacter chungangensis]
MPSNECDEPRVSDAAADGDATSGRTGWAELLDREHLPAAIVLAGGVALYAISTFVTAALLPSVVAEIGGGHYFAWVTTVFLIASVFASMLVTRLLRRLGAARGYLVAFGLFAAGSLLAAASPTMEMLLVARAAQGLGAGLLAGLGYAVIRSALPPRLWTRATGLVSAMWALGTLVGPALGGLFAQLGLWRWAFALLAVTAVVLGVVALRRLPGERTATPEAERDGGRLPVWSLVTLVAAAAAFSIASVVPVGPVTLAAIAVGALLTVLFVVVDRRSRDAVLPRLAYRRGNPLKWIYLTLGLISGGSMLEMYLPRFGQELAGLSPLLAGIFGASLSIGWSVSQIVSAGVDAPAARRRLMVLGPVLLAVALAIFAAVQRGDAGVALVWCWTALLVAAGTGIGIAFPHLSVAALASTSDEAEASKAAAGVGTAELVSGAIASALVGVFVALGGSEPAAAATSMSVGVAVLGGLGVLTAIATVRGIRTRGTAPDA